MQKSDLEYSRRTQSLQRQLILHRFLECPSQTQLKLASGSCTEVNQPLNMGRQASAKAGPEKGVRLKHPSLRVSLAIYSLSNRSPQFGPRAGASWLHCFGEKTAPPPWGQSRGWAQTTTAPPSCGVASPPDVKAGGGEPGATPSRTEGCLLDTMVWNASRS